MQAAHVVLVRRPSAAMRGLWPWIEQASKRLHRNMLAIALANKLARIAWAVLARSRISAADYAPCGVTQLVTVNASGPTWVSARIQDSLSERPHRAHHGTQSVGCAGQTVRPSLHSISQTSAGKLFNGPF